MDATPALFCYDGSAGAHAALERGAELCQGRRALVLCVWQPASLMEGTSPFAGLPFDQIPFEDTEPIDRMLAERAMQIAREGCERLARDGVTAEPLTAAAPASVWRGVLEVADQRDAAVIVVGSRGHSGISSLVLGSVSHGLVNHSGRPVLVVPSRPGAQPATESPGA